MYSGYAQIRSSPTVSLCVKSKQETSDPQQFRMFYKQSCHCPHRFVCGDSRREVVRRRGSASRRIPPWLRFLQKMGYLPASHTLRHMRTRLHVLVFVERNIMDVISARIWLTAAGIAKQIHTSLISHTGKGFFLTCRSCRQSSTRTEYGEFVRGGTHNTTCCT